MEKSRKEYMREYYKKNKERILENVKKYQQENPYKQQEYNKNWYGKNKEEVNKKQREYRKNNLEKKREYGLNKFYEYKKYGCYEGIENGNIMQAREWSKKYSADVRNLESELAEKHNIKVIQLTQSGNVETAILSKKYLSEGNIGKARELYNKLNEFGTKAKNKALKLYTKEELNKLEE